MSFPTLLGTGVEGVPCREPQVCLGPAFGNATYNFFVAGSGFVTPANVYQDAALVTPFPTVGFVGSDQFGRFPPIYLDGSINYGVQLTDGQGNTVYSQDPYTPTLSVRGLSTNVAFGPQIATTGEIVLPAPAAGGSNITLKLTATVAGQSCLQIMSTLAGQPALVVNNSVTTGAQTATFSATNKPGTATSTPAGWLPILADGVLYYTPIWHGNNFTPYVPNPSAIGEVINSIYVKFNGDGTTTATGGTAVPSNWFTPTSTNTGHLYWINITKTSGNTGTSFSAAQGAWVNITDSGLQIGTAGSVNTVLQGTYQLSTSAGGSPVVANGTIQLSGNSTGASPGTGANDLVAYNGAAPLVLNGNGTGTLNGVAVSNWFLPTTASTGHLYWINITRTGGTSGVNFSAAQGTFTNISDTGLTITLTGTGQRNAQGTYQISSNSGGTLVVSSGTISMTASGVLNTNWSGTTPLVLKGDGTTTLGGSASTNWFSPTTANTGSGYWINITRTSGTTGVNFSAAQGSWTNITNTSLTIDMSGTAGNVGTVTVNGTYQISSASNGNPVLGSGTITLNKSGLTVVHVYTTVVTSATETIPTGTTNLKIAVWGSGGGGAGGQGSGCSANNGSGGGSGGRAFTTNTAAAYGGAGKTFKYTIVAGGLAGSFHSNGSAAGNNTVVAGTATGFASMAGNGGGGGIGVNTGGAAGTASGGVTSNTTGNVGQAGTFGGQGAAGLGTVITGDAAPHGGGGAGGFGGSGVAGTIGAVVFFYS